MEITGTLSKIYDYFKEWHSKNYATLHAEDTRINGINDDLNATNNAVLKIMQLLGRKINNANIQEIDDFDTQFNNNSYWNDNTLNLKDMNDRINNNARAFYDGEVIPKQSNLDGYMTPGIYRYPDIDVQTTIIDNTEVPNILNAPEDLKTRFNLRVLKYAGGSLLQILSSYNNNIYIRSSSGSTWQKDDITGKAIWYKIYNESKKIIANDIGWGQQFASTPGPIDAATISDINANRIAFLPADCINVYTNNNKTISYKSKANNNAPLNDTAKKSLISSSYKLYGGGKDDTNFLDEINDKNQKIVVEIKANHTETISNTQQDMYKVYAHLRKIYVHISKNKCDKVTVKIKANGYDKNNNSVLKEPHIDEGLSDGYELVGLSGGWNIIPLNIYFGDYNEPTNSKEDHYHTVTLTFENADVNNATKYDDNETPEVNASKITTPEMYCVDAIRFIGEQIFIAPSTMAETGHIYKYDGDQNVTFPNHINGPGLTGKSIISTTHDNGSYRLVIHEDIKMAELYVHYQTNTLPTANSSGDRIATITKNNTSVTIPSEYRPMSSWMAIGNTNFGAPLKINSNDGTIQLINVTRTNNYYGTCIWSYNVKI